MNHTLTLRPAFTPFTIVLMVLLFMVAWPLGLLMLAYLLWGDRLSFSGNGTSTTSGARRSFRSAGCFGWNGSASTRHDSGNAAFDEYRAKELKRIEEERRRLDEERREFETFVQNLRRAKDQEEFDRFMAARRSGPGPTINL